MSRNKTLQQRLEEAKKGSPTQVMNRKQITNAIHNQEQRMIGSELSQQERKQLSIRNTKHCLKGWEVDEEKRKERIRNTRNGIWGDEEKRKQQGPLISKGKLLNHPTRGKAHPQKVKQEISKHLIGRKKPQYGQVLSTPRGIFPTRNSVAQEYNVKPDTVSKWINKGTGPGEFKWIKAKPSATAVETVNKK